jgi:cytochrome c-type biogenesis protein CcmE
MTDANHDKPAAETDRNDPADPHDGADPPAVATAPRTAPVRKKRAPIGQWVMVGVILAVVGLVGSTFKAGQGALVYSKYVDEVMAEPGRYQSQGELRVEGMVQTGTVQNSSGSREFRFRVERNGRSMPVRYVGIVPDTFREGIGVTVRGRLLASGEFDAREVVAKCPSKYEMRAAQQRGERMPGDMLGTPAPGTTR